MSIIYILIPLAILLIAIGLMCFFWAVKHNQFDDLERQGYSILFDDDLPPQKPSSSSKVSEKSSDSTDPKTRTPK